MTAPAITAGEFVGGELVESVSPLPLLWGGERGVVRVGIGVWLEWGEGCGERGVVRVGRGVWLEWGEGCG